jgi:hypothetical protein
MGFALAHVCALTGASHGRDSPATRSARQRSSGDSPTNPLCTACHNLTQRLGILTLTNSRVLTAAILALILTAQGFGILLPAEIRILKQLLSDTPDTELIGRLGMRNARLGAIRAVLQFGMIFVMAS